MEKTPQYPEDGVKHMKREWRVGAPKVCSELRERGTYQLLWFLYYQTTCSRTGVGNLQDQEDNQQPIRTFPLCYT